MSTFLFVSIPIPAHTTNLMPFAARLVEAGHRVLWLAGSSFHERLSTTGAVPQPYVATPDFGATEVDAFFPQLAGLEGIAAIRRGFADIFVGLAPQRVADIDAILREHEVDAVLTDLLSYGVGLAHERGGPVWATMGDGPLPFEDVDVPPFGPALSPLRGPLGRARNRQLRWLRDRLIFASVNLRYAAVRAELGLPAASRPALDDSPSPYLHVQGCTPGFEYPRREVPAHSHWVGALRPEPAAGWVPPRWWTEVTSHARPVVFVSQGSIRPDVTELLQPAVHGLAGTDALVVVATGRGTPQALVCSLDGSVPPNVRVTDFVPYDEILRHADCFVTNGGYTGVTLALSHGVPLVQAGNTEEKAEIAARIAYTGVGVRLGTTRPTSQQVRSGVERVLRDPAYRNAARRVQAELDGHDAGREGALLLERLAETQRPVLRSDVRDLLRGQEPAPGPDAASPVSG